MAEEHADELMVAHLDGRMRAAQPAGEYPAPTDAELDELRQANSGKLNFVTLSEFRTIARAVLAKWGAQQPVALEPLSAEQYNILVEDLSEWSRHVEVDTAPRSLEEHIHQVFAIHGIKGGQHGTE